MHCIKWCKLPWVTPNIYSCKKTVVYHLVNGCTVLLHIENSKNDRLKVILLCSTLTFRQTATMCNNSIQPLTR